MSAILKLLFVTLAISATLISVEARPADDDAPETDVKPTEKSEIAPMPKNDTKDTTVASDTVAETVRIFSLPRTQNKLLKTVPKVCFG